MSEQGAGGSRAQMIAPHTQDKHPSTLWRQDPPPQHGSLLPHLLGAATRSPVLPPHPPDDSPEVVLEVLSVLMRTSSSRMLPVDSRRRRRILSSRSCQGGEGGCE